MDFRQIKTFFFATLALLFLAPAAFSQKMTTVKGIVIDAETKEPMPLVNISFKGTTIGTTTEFDGSFVLESKWASDQLEVSFIGYESQTFPVELGLKQEINVSLASTSLTIATVVVKGEKKRYKRKNNPNVEFMRNVIDHKNDNRLEASEYYDVDKYEKIQFDINNFDPEKLKQRRAFKKFQFLFDYVDTSQLNGKPFLPFFIQESVSKVYYRKEPKATREYRSGVKVTGMEEYVDSEDLTTMMEVLYQKVNIYDNNIRLLDLNFVSPLNDDLAISYYRFYITDSMAVMNGLPCKKVSFYPENSQNIGFKGDLWVLKDSSYAVIKAEFGISRQINVNFVQDMRLTQTFEKTKDGVWAIAKDQLFIDFSILKRGTGFYGTRDVSYKNLVINEKRDNSVYDGTEKIVDDPDAYKRDTSFWANSRHVALSQKEQGIYNMIDTLQKAPTFRTTMQVLTLLFTGYKAVGPVDVGPIANFVSFNPVEGFRSKVGGETNLKFHPKLMLAGYGAYGTEDKKWKYGGSVLYSFREDFKTNPRHYLRLNYQHDVILVGQILQYNSPDNFFLSFQRGTRENMLFIDRWSGEYQLEMNNKLTVQFNYANSLQKAYGSLQMRYLDPVTQEEALLPQFRNSEAALTLRFAPNEQYVQGRTYRTPFYNQYPVFILKATAGLKDVLGGDYDYKGLSLNIYKRFNISLLGSLRLDAEAGKFWGDGLPYFLYYLPKANQTYTFRTNSFNMMNYQEFISDEYAWVMLEHNFNGFILNKVPLLRKLKLRESISFKAMYGRLTDANNPDKNPNLIQFLNNEEGERLTYSLHEKPYVEASVGIGNIVKFLRFDLVQRFNYLENPDVPTLFGKKGLGIRVKASAKF